MEMRRKTRRIEAALLEWLKNARLKKEISISRGILLKETKQFAQMVNYENFRPTVDFCHVRGNKRISFIANCSAKSRMRVWMLQITGKKKFCPIC